MRCLKFCDDCGSYMEKTTEGFICPQCGKVVNARIVEVKNVEDHEPPIYTIS